MIEEECHLPAVGVIDPRHVVMAFDRMSWQANQDTGAEPAVRQPVQAAGHRCRTHCPVPVMLGRKMDIASLHAKLAVLFDGCARSVPPAPRRTRRGRREKLDRILERGPEANAQLVSGVWVMLCFREHESPGSGVRQGAAAGGRKRADRRKRGKGGGR